MPEVAARAHLRWIVPVLDEAWADAGASWDDVDAVAVTYGPGLAGSLLVGINFAKALAWVHEKPLVGVNHLEGHVYAAWLRDPGETDRPDPVFPLVTLVVSGGHTFIAEMRDHLTYRLLGTTLDDAAGEAFDKVGRLLGLGYPGGPAIGRAAEAATRHDRVFPRAWLGDSYDLSFSGLKTAARRIITEARADAGLAGTPEAPLPDDVVAELAWGFQDAVVDVLVTKTIRAAEATNARSIVMGGGVAANAVLRARLAGEAEARGLPLIVPRPALCTDNGAMIGAAGARRFAAGERAGLDLDARPSAAPRRAMSRSTAPRVDPDAVRATLRAAGIRARHSLSQNFLADPDVLDAILAEADPPPGRRVLEIGPGLGLLTAGLLSAGATVTAVELDRDLAAFLRERFEGVESLSLIEGDALDQDLVHLVDAPYDVVANLPYHITSPILHALLGSPPRPERLVLMVQREVAERIAAPPGKMSYLSVFVQYHARVRIAFAVPAAAFEPEPAVESAVIVVEPYDADDRLDAESEDELWRLVQAAFRERRKMIHNVLSRQLPLDAGRVTGALATAGIDPDRRPQTLAVGEWLALHAALGPIGPDGRGRRAAS